METVTSRHALCTTVIAAPGFLFHTTAAGSPNTPTDIYTPSVPSFFQVYTRSTTLYRQPITNMGGGGYGGLRSLLFYLNVSGMCPRSSSQPLTIPAPWVLLRVWGSIPLFDWFHLG